jgi:hypothetical protein
MFLEDLFEDLKKEIDSSEEADQWFSGFKNQEKLISSISGYCPCILPAHIHH